MKKVRRVVLIAALIGAIVCIVLLLNFTASNPTHRRYSSQTVLVTGQATGSAIGRNGEQILSKDLGLPRNDQANQRHCICGTSATAYQQTQCNTCIVSLPTIESYRRPDFVSSKLIADAKNQRSLLVRDRDFEQLRDYADAAKELDIPLWVFTRVNTYVDPEYGDMVRSTGGDVIFYFAVPGYEDPVDDAAEKGLVAAVIAGIAAALPEVPLARPRLRRFRKEASARGTATLNDAEQLLARMKDKARDG